jgi:hypothetical protein
MIVNRNRAGQGLAGTVASLLGGDLPGGDPGLRRQLGRSVGRARDARHTSRSCSLVSSTSRKYDSGSRRYEYWFAKVRISNLLEQQSWSEHDY